MKKCFDSAFRMVPQTPFKDFNFFWETAPVLLLGGLPREEHEVFGESLRTWLSAESKLAALLKKRNRQTGPQFKSAVRGHFLQKGSLKK